MNSSALSELLTRVDLFKSDYDKLCPVQEPLMRKIWDKVHLEWNYHSNAIEGNRLTFGETRALLLSGETSSGKTYAEHRDIRGHDKAILFVREALIGNEEVSERLIRDLHKILMVEEHFVEAITSEGQKTHKKIVPGEYKSEPNCVEIGGKKKLYCLPQFVVPKLHELLQWYKKKRKDGKDPGILVASIFHHRFTEIHPFDDGNGRLARLLLNFVLMQYSYPPVVLSVRDREQYVEALRAADASPDDTYQLTSLIGQSMLASLDLHIRGARGENIEDITDLDKEMVLLRHELEKRPEPEPRSPHALAKCFEHSLIPLAIRMSSKLSEFDGYFTSSEIRIRGGVVQQLNTSLQLRKDIEKTMKLAELPDFLRHLAATERVTVQSLEIVLTWREFKKGGLNIFDYHTSVHIEFDSLKFKVAAGRDSGTPKTIEQWYQHELGEDGIRDLVDALRKNFLDRIKQAIRNR